MPSYSSFLAPARRSLAAHLARLCDALDSLGKQVREAITRVIGRTAAEAVTEAVEGLLAVAAVRSPPNRYPRYYDHTSSLADRPPGTAWSYDRDDWDDLDRVPERYADEEGDAYPSATANQPTLPYEVRLRLAMLAGCQATGWWLQRHPQQLAVPAAVGLGLFTGLITFVSGSVIIAGAGGFLSVLSLLALADAVRTGAGGVGRTAPR